MNLRVPSDTPIGKLSAKIMLQLRNDLDTAPESQNWRALVALLEKRPYIFSQAEIEKFAMQIYSNGSPSDQLLLALGARGMCAKELVYYLDKLRLEKILREFRNYEPIKITEQPQEISKPFEGECVSLHVVATGFPYPRYQWFKGQEQMDGEIESTLKLDNIRLCDSGMYCCRLHNCGENSKVVFSNYAEIDVYPEVKVDMPMKKYPQIQRDPSGDDNMETDLLKECNLPVITSHPRNIYIFSGNTFFLVCEAKGKPPLTYTWYRDNDKFFAETQSPALQVDKAGPHHSGRYVCHVRNNFGEVVSIPAIITVAMDTHPLDNPMPQITVQPINCQVSYGGIAMFTCEAVGRMPLSYQWFQNDMALQGPGANLPQLTLQGVTSDAVLHCLISNSFGLTCSSRAILRVRSYANHNYQPIPSVPYTATDKVALLIGNYNYRCENILNAPKSDIQILSEIFRYDLNFRVVSLLNLTLTEMKAAVAEFCELLGDGVYSVFYFCGHGFEENGQCYFVPEDAQTDFSEKDCLCADTVLASMQQKKPRICTMILDICRKRNKNGPSQGDSAPVTINPSYGNCCTCYATCTGLAAYEIGDSGILVKHLQNHLRQPIKIEDVFARMRDDIGKDKLVIRKQIPEVRTTILETERSFCDPISYRNGWTEAFNRRSLAWENAHKIPEPITLHGCPELGIILELEFQSSFSNVLQVFVTVKDKGKTQQCIAWIARMPNTVSVIETPSMVSEGKTKNSIQDIQKLKDDLVIHLAIRFRRLGSNTEEEKCLEKVNLGLPLVAPLRLWNPRPMLREPTEQTEEVDMLPNGVGSDKILT